MRHTPRRYPTFRESLIEAPAPVQAALLALDRALTEAYGVDYALIVVANGYMLAASAAKEG